MIIYWLVDLKMDTVHESGVSGIFAHNPKVPGPNPGL